MAVVFTEERPIAQDGVRLHLKTWAPTDGEPRARLLVLHGYGEHGGRYRELGHHLVDRGFAVSALDYRGHGRAEGRRGFVEAFASYHDDVDAGLAALEGEQPRFLLGHSLGGLIALDYVGRNGPRVAELSGLVVTNPYLALAMEVPGYKVLLANSMAKLYPKLALPSGLPTDGLSRQEGVREAYERDPLVFSVATTGWFRASSAAQRRVRGLRQLPLPCFYVYSDADPIAAPAANRQLAEQLHSEVEILLRPGELHEVLNELDREELYARIADWLEARL